jgi:hypothetical protein
MIDHSRRVGRAERRLPVAACHLGPERSLRQGPARLAPAGGSIVITSSWPRRIPGKSEQCAPLVTLLHGRPHLRRGRPGIALSGGNDQEPFGHGSGAPPAPAGATRAGFAPRIDRKRKRRSSARGAGPGLCSARGGDGCRGSWARDRDCSSETGSERFEDDVRVEAQTGVALLPCDRLVRWNRFCTDPGPRRELGPAEASAAVPRGGGAGRSAAEFRDGARSRDGFFPSHGSEHQAAAFSSSATTPADEPSHSNATGPSSTG